MKSSGSDFEFRIWGLLYSKTLVEEVNLLVWATFDFAWMRAADSKILLALGVLALSLQCVQFVMDLRKCSLIFNSEKFNTNDALEDLFLILAMIFWLISNIIWGCGETKSLNGSATFNSFYEKETKKAEKILCISILFVMAYASLALVRIMRGRTIRFKILDGVEKRLDDASLTTAFFSTPISSPDKVNNFMNKLTRDGQERYAEARRISTNLQNNYQPTVRVRRYYNERGVDIPLNKEVTEFWRLIEELFLLFWILKDFSWMHEWVVCWIVSAVLILCTSMFFIWNVLNSHNKKDPAYKCGSLTILLAIWSLSNIVWASGELFFSDHVNGIPSGNPEKVRDE